MPKLQKFEVALTLPFGKVGGTWVPDEDETRAAWELYVELVTRTSVVELEPDEGVLREARSSLHTLFNTTRIILKEHGPGVAKPKANGQLSFGYLAVAVLNLGVRPVLAKWYPLLVDWESKREPGTSVTVHEAAWSRSQELRGELADLRVPLIQYADTLARVAGVPSLLVGPGDDEALPSGPR